MGRRTGDDRSVDGAGAGAAQLSDGDSAAGEEHVEHAPGVSTPRASALQRKPDRLLCFLRRGDKLSTIFCKVFFHSWRSTKACGPSTMLTPVSAALERPRLSIASARPT